MVQPFFSIPGHLNPILFKLTLDQIPFQEISSLAIWVPLIMAGKRWKTGGQKLRLFFVFLLFGALVDGFGWFTFWTGGDFFIHSIFQFLYLNFEAFFFFWLCTGFLKWHKALLIRNIFFALILILFLIRAWISFFNEIDPYNPPVFSSVVDAVFLVMISFLSAFALLHMAEKREDLVGYAWFWILSGIFFYSFGSFFIDLLAHTEIIGEVWRIRNVVNVIQYGFFVGGLARLKLVKPNSTSNMPISS